MIGMSLKFIEKCTVAAATLMLLFPTACKSGNEQAGNDEGNELYKESLAIINSYTDSISEAKDSAKIESLYSSFDNALTKLNYKHTADTDLRLSEAQNDTLTKATLRLVHLRDSLLYKFAHPLNSVDSAATDSVSMPCVE